MSHTFHIPVLGLGYSIDTPLKVARYGISSVVSIVDDELVERMRAFHSQDKACFEPIKRSEYDHRAKRITAYLNLLDELISRQHNEMADQPFLPGQEITKYFELLPDDSQERILYKRMLSETQKDIRLEFEKMLRQSLKKGAVDVNIMAKVDKANYDKQGNPCDDNFSDALASLRGFANSRLSSSVILSAGINPRLYSYMEEFKDFFPQEEHPATKKIILKVSDFRSAFIQAKFLAKKGLWVHEFRIESGLNCGGHAFATDGYLLGPILEEFKEKRLAMIGELYEIYQSGLLSKSIQSAILPNTRITVQGGIGTAEEDKFIREYYQLDGTGWGSPFLLVPEVTNVDNETLHQLANSEEDDFYVSSASPLGIPFNNFKKSSAEKLRLERIAKGRPGSPCTKKFLVSNTEFTEKPICTSSREYQRLKIHELELKQLPATEHDLRFKEITEKVCLCEGLCSSAYIKNSMLKPRETHAVTICPGPNTAYFKSIYSLEEMAKHIYGKINLIENIKRPNMFLKELGIYVSYLQKDIEANVSTITSKKVKQLQRFKEELLSGIDYYLQLIQKMPSPEITEADLNKWILSLTRIEIPAIPQ